MDDLPPLIENGSVAQVLVEFCNKAVHGTFSITGPASGTRYRFAGTPGKDFRWVRSEDEERFGLNADFIVHTDHRHDPALEREREMRDELARLSRELAAFQAAPVNSAKRDVARMGRPRIPASDNFRAWHLWKHCDWLQWQVADELGMMTGGALSKRLREWQATTTPPSPGDCQLCTEGWLPPRPNQSI